MKVPYFFTSPTFVDRTHLGSEKVLAEEEKKDVEHEYQEWMTSGGKY